MMQADVLRWLLESSCAGSAAIIVVLLLRQPLRAAFGANAAYLLWSLLPLSVLTATLPAPVVHVSFVRGAAGAGDALAAHGGALAAGGGPMSWLPPVWCAGLLAAMFSQIALQRRFRRRLGMLHPVGGGLLRAEASAGLPAVVGLRASIVLPADFEARYSAGERALVLAHERVHRVRGDVAAHLLMSVLCCVYWFNPLLWIAAERFRRDQELACDEIVIARHPHARRAYGEAMLKTQLSAVPAPLSCHWFGGHPLKERLAMLKHPIPSARRVATGLLLAGCIVTVTAYAAWTARPASHVVDDSEPAAAPARAAGAEAQRADADTHVDARSKSNAPPKYPADAATNRITGRVLLVVDVAADGSVADARVEKSEPAGVFDQVTLDAAKNWRFAPAIKDGKPVAGRVRVPVDFAMDPPQDEQPGDAGGRA